MTAIKWEDIKEGEEVCSSIKQPSFMQLFMFSAVTWNRHLIHYNTEFAHNDGLPGVATHRALIGNFCAQMLTNWVGDSGKLTKLEWSVRNTAIPGDTLTCKGKALEKLAEADKRLVKCEVTVVNQQGDLIAQGTGEVEFY
ncbi:MAG: MaoC family dehydratase [Bacillota bacterium]